MNDKKIYLYTWLYIYFNYSYLEVCCPINSG